MYFTSFSIGHFYTKSFADYNGPFSIFSPHPGLSELARKSNFKGKIIKTKCYLSLTNKELIKKFKYFAKSIEKKQNIIIPESNPNWFFGLSNHESNLFASLIYSLSLNINVNILIKKKKIKF